MASIVNKATLTEELLQKVSIEGSSSLNLGKAFNTDDLWVDNFQMIAEDGVITFTSNSNVTDFFQRLSSAWGIKVTHEFFDSDAYTHDYVYSYDSGVLTESREVANKKAVAIKSFDKTRHYLCVSSEVRDTLLENT